MQKIRTQWLQSRRRLSEIIEVGTSDDWISRGYDVLSTLLLLTNVTVTVLYTFDEMEQKYGAALLMLEAITIAFFAFDYVLRLFSAQFQYPSLSEFQALRKYILSFSGLIDLMSFFAILFAVLFSDWRCGFSYVPCHTDFSVIPDQCLL